MSWDEAPEDIARRLARCREDDGGESIGAYVGNPMAFAGANYDMVIAAVAGYPDHFVIRRLTTRIRPA